MAIDEARLRNQVCQAAQQLWIRGLIAGDGGLVTAELYRRRYLATPVGKRRADLLPEDLICVDVGGEGIQGGPGLDLVQWQPHRVAYQNWSNLEADSAGVDNGQLLPVHATILAEPAHVMAMLHLLPQERELRLGCHSPLPLLEPTDAEPLRAALSQNRVVVLRGLGLMAAAASLPEALNTIERIEHAASIEIASHRGP